MQHNIIVEVVFALPDQQLIIPVNVAVGSTVEQAILASNILHEFTEIDLNINKVGIFGKIVTLDTPLRHLDRVEIYRPLIADPKEVRRQRAATGKAMKKGAVSEAS